MLIKRTVGLCLVSYTWILLFVCLLFFCSFSCNVRVHTTWWDNNSYVNTALSLEEIHGIDENDCGKFASLFCPSLSLLSTRNSNKIFKFSNLVTFFCECNHLFFSLSLMFYVWPFQFFEMMHIKGIIYFFPIETFSFLTSAS